MVEQNAIIPIGKYKGQPVEVLAADPSYREWLTSQDWFRERYVNLYQTIINYGGAPQDSPEHNQMQAMFLDDEYCLRLGKLLWPGREWRVAVRIPNEDSALIEKYRPHVVEEWSPAHVSVRQFEAAGWDVRYELASASCNVEVGEGVCICRCDHFDCPQDSDCNGGQIDRCIHKHSAPRTNYYDHCDPECPFRVAFAQRVRGNTHEYEWLKGMFHTYDNNWRGAALVELKPDLSDDFPSVLRQVLRYEHSGSDRPCVVVRRASFEHVTWDQVVTMFSESGIRLIMESEILAK